MRPLALAIATTLLFCGSERDAGAPAETNDTATTPSPGKETPMAFHLTSTAFDEGGAIPVRHSCDGEDVSPPLAWSEVPDGTQAYALTLTDPDAPGGTFTHWVLYDLPGHAGELPEGVGDAPRLENLGGALQGQSDFGETGYGGPCPPAGSSHRYVLTLYALDAPTDLEAGASRGELQSAIEGHVLGSAELTGTYRRRG